MIVHVSSWIKLEGTGFDVSCHGEALYYKGTSFDVLPFPSPILVPQLAKMSSGRVGELHLWCLKPTVVASGPKCIQQERLGPKQRRAISAIPTHPFAVTHQSLNSWQFLLLFILVQALFEAA